MEINIKLILDNEALEKTYSKKYEIYEDVKDDCFNLQILTDYNESYNDLSQNIETIKNNLNIIYNQNNIDAEINFNYLKQFLNRDAEFYKSIFDNAEYIEIQDSQQNILKYIEKNPELKSKKIIINGIFDLDDKLINETRNLFKDYSNIYVYLNGNRTPVNLEDCKKTIKIIDDIVNEIKTFNYSPAEQLFYAYDLIRDRVYKEENTNEEQYVSRDLTSILLGENIVCEGYANEFDKILTKLGIKTMIYYLDSTTNDKLGHARNIVHLVDDKYNIDGVYYFDTTWDSKKSNNDINFLNSYKFFAKTKDEIEKLENSEYADATFSYFNEDLPYIFENYYDLGGIKNVPENITKTINRVSNFIDKEIDIPSLIYIPGFPLEIEIDKNQIINKLKEYIDLFNKPLDADTLLKILYNVRKNEYYNNPTKYPFDVNDLFKTVINSNWEFNNPESKLINALFDNEINKTTIKVKKNDMIKHIINNNLDTKIEQVKLTKTLKKVYEKKSNNN